MFFYNFTVIEQIKLYFGLLIHFYFKDVTKMGKHEIIKKVIVSYITGDN